ncbi:MULTISPECIES: nitroreductase family protein [Pseudomonas]|uniref:nitroreductase family protein n=1 Tax=Pseudomonas TaxID=286 RepID=UPI00071F555A|nr:MULTISPECIES: nitroreductase family protein [Pseudomonas]ALQ02636.1 NADH dehydrogenase [Pseudomonas brassicacearum]
MKVSEALKSRRSTRAFLDRPVEPALIRRLVELAARAPSGGNLQPWRLYVLGGGALVGLKRIMAARVAAAPKGEGTEYEVYPSALATPYSERRFSIGESMYESLGVSRDDRQGRRQWFNRNYQFFDAPLGIFCFVERYMGPPQWSDLGMYLQSLMLLLREEGLDSCAQECWALFHQTVSSYVDAPSNLMLFAGMSIGYADPVHPVNNVSSHRAELDEFATFMGI